MKTYEKTCRFCKKEFIGINKRVLCSLKCCGLEQRDRLIKGNIGRRKYEQVFGLNRVQLFRLNNPDKTLNEYHRDRAKRLIVINHLGNKCFRCGYNQDMRALELDHIFNDGHLERKQKGMKGKIYRYYSKNLEEASQRLQILCSNCNKIKQIEEHEFAYQAKLRKKKSK